MVEHAEVGPALDFEFGIADFGNMAAVSAAPWVKSFVVGGSVDCNRSYAVVADCIVAVEHTSARRHHYYVGLKEDDDSLADTNIVVAGLANNPTALDIHIVNDPPYCCNFRILSLYRNLY